MAVAILQARMTSTRLPGKVMRSLAGAPMIERQIERIRRARRLARLIVATSDDPSDNPLVGHLRGLGVEVYRGSLSDVLGRFVEAADAHGLEGQVVRLTADCPLADPSVIDACIKLHGEGDADYCSNSRKRTFPRGLDVEVCDINALRRAGREATEPYDREHVTPYLYRYGKFRTTDLVQMRDESHLRWTVDTPEDFAFVEGVYRTLYPAKPDFTSDDVRRLSFSHYEPGMEPK